MPPRHPNDVRDETMQTTRQSLLDAAAGEFAQYGYDKANVNRIAKAAGFSIGTLYNYFPTKRDLMNEFINEVSKDHVEAIIERVKNEEHSLQRTEAFFKAGFEFVETNPTHSRAIFNTLNGPDDEFKIKLYQEYVPLFQLINEDILGLGIQEGEFRSLDQAVTANLLMLIYLGTGSQFSPEGKLWMDPMQVADFVLKALRK